MDKQVLASDGLTKLMTSGCSSRTARTLLHRSARLHHAAARSSSRSVTNRVMTVLRRSGAMNAP
jgi:hypothetical protein